MPSKASSIVEPLSPEYGDTEDDAALPEIVEAAEAESPSPAEPESAKAAKARLAALRLKYGDEPGFILDPPVEYQGRTIEFISIDLSKLKGSDLKAIGREFKARYKPDSESYFLENNYLILLFARINGLDEGFFDRLNGVTYLQLTEFYKIRMKQVLGN